jgi:dTDP-4-dehydrorhamnose 3,5-epimerase-like enzyme
MKLIATSLNGAFIVESAFHRDVRGSFLEIFSARGLAESGLQVDFVQDNCSHSKVRGCCGGCTSRRIPAPRPSSSGP